MEATATTHTMNDVRIRLLKGAAVLISAIFPVLAAYYAGLHLSNAPLGDMIYYQAPVAIAVSEGQGILRAVFVPVIGVHYIVPTALVTAFLSLTSNWNLHYETTFNFVLMSVNFWIVLWLLRKEGLLWGGLVPVTALFWTTNQDINLYIGLHNVWHFVHLFFFGALLTLFWGQPSWRRMMLAAIFGLWATFTIASGVLVWVAVLPVLLTSYRKRGYLLFWFGAFLVAALLLWAAPGADASTVLEQTQNGGANVPVNPLTLALFFLSTLGAMFTFGVKLWLAAVVGVIGLAVFVANGVFLYRSGEKQFVLLWGSVALFALLSLALISLGRIGWGIERSQHPHYTSTSALFWIATVVLVVKTMLLSESNVVAKRITMISVLAAVILIPLHTLSTMEVWYGNQWYTPDRIAHFEACLAQYPETGDSACMEGFTFTEFDFYAPIVDSLYEQRLAVYRNH